MERGRRSDQENFNKSKDASLGRVALIQITTKIISEAFNISQKACSKYKRIEHIELSWQIRLLKYTPNGERYPPKNIIAKKS